MEAKQIQQEPAISESTSATDVTYFGSQEGNQRENNQAFADVYEVIYIHSELKMLNCINLMQQPAVVYENICGQLLMNYTIVVLGFTICCISTPST